MLTPGFHFREGVQRRGKESVYQSVLSSERDVFREARLRGRLQNSGRARNSQQHLKYLTWSVWSNPQMAGSFSSGTITLDQTQASGQRGRRGTDGEAQWRA